ncbi:acetylpolyamine amidohydrolase [Legionella antarctica]|uniref:Acetylpolyamine amidohydrolase n=1 Tax=Legionella antarctica TaxID=2708020 RepID=A0A6F8T350_9GAMM|nr:acetylpolyamine aminohydrolase [Legionella antarctica]BCA94828.1 acetylpolyamine amidohydrolase [Legionella antarctica]
MNRKFFIEPSLSLLEKRILCCITNISSSNPEEIQTSSRLKDYLLELKNYTQDTEFANIGLGLKREALKLLQSLDDQMNSEPSECFIQIPSEQHVEQMKGMPAGGIEDQNIRLIHMSNAIRKGQKKHSMLPVITTEDVSLPQVWEELFAAINKGCKKEAFALLKQISSQDRIFQPLLAVHPIDYLKKIISYSIDAQRTGLKKINADILITPHTFELLIKDIATTLMHPAKCYFSFGLPTHHAFSRESSGFCIFNKIAILIKNAELTHPNPLKHIIIGPDVNRDNGLSAVLRESFSCLDICHIDIFDSRVYPHQDHSFIEYEFQTQGKAEQQQIKSWHQNQMDYYAVDLKLTIRSSISIHPALLFSLGKIKENIVNAKRTGQKIVLYLATGWDSHENETAYCGKFINDRMMSQSEAGTTRFNDGDLSYFFEEILTLYSENKELIESIYWGLEGGYERRMYEKQIQLMLDTIDGQLLHEDINQSSLGINC